jgi:putative Holliday junction resolvase
LHSQNNPKVLIGRIIAIDYGQKRVGLAVTDVEQIIATSLTTVRAMDAIPFLKDYVSREPVVLFLVGEPRQMNNQVSESARFIEPFVKQLKKSFPDIPVERVDERFTSKMALSAIREAGLKKKDRENKSLVDTVSATIILQSYLDQLSYRSKN